MRDQRHSPFNPLDHHYCPPIIAACDFHSSPLAFSHHFRHRLFPSDPSLTPLIHVFCVVASFSSSSLSPDVGRNAHTACLLLTPGFIANFGAVRGNFLSCPRARLSHAPWFLARLRPRTATPQHACCTASGFRSPLFERPLINSHITTQDTRRSVDSSWSPFSDGASLTFLKTRQCQRADCFAFQVQRQVGGAPAAHPERHHGGALRHGRHHGAAAR